jgi:hypothetical protein
MKPAVPYIRVALRGRLVVLAVFACAMAIINWFAPLDHSRHELVLLALASLAGFSALWSP